jgi:hypothetical protein
LLHELVGTLPLRVALNGSTCGLPVLSVKADTAGHCGITLPMLLLSLLLFLLC